MLAAVDKPALAWLAFSLVCAVVELLSRTFGAVLIAAAALLACVFAASGYGLAVQLVAFFVGGTLAVTVLRTRIMEKVAVAPGVPSRIDRMIGRPARVVETIDPVGGHGRVLVDGTDWAAFAAERIEAGTEVRVKGADGIRLEVSR